MAGKGQRVVGVPIENHPHILEEIADIGKAKGFPSKASVVRWAITFAHQALGLHKERS